MEFDDFDLFEAEEEYDDGMGYDEYVTREGLVIRDFEVIGYQGEGGHVIIDEGIRVQDLVFAENEKITRLTVTEEIEELGDETFRDCPNLVSVDLACSNVTRIGIGLFSNCHSLSNVFLPKQVTEIESNAFDFCARLQKIEISKSLSKIGAEAFLGCENLAEFIVHEDNPAYRSIDGNLYSKDGKTLIQYAAGKLESEFIIPNGVVTISSGAFVKCENLKNVIISDTVKTIESMAFRGNSNLRNIVLGAGVCELEQNALFCDFENIEVVETNKCFTSIDGNLYSKDTKTLLLYASGKSEERFNVPNSIERIAPNAFNSALNLTYVNIPGSVSEIGENAFFGCRQLATISVAENNSSYCDLDGHLYTKDQTTFIFFAPGKHLDAFIIPDTVICIEDYSFFNCKLKTITLSQKTKRIGTCAFETSINLRSIDIPDSVVEIDTKAFASCENLKNLKIGKGLSRFGSWAFLSCHNLENVKIGSNIKELDSFVFCGCKKLTFYTVKGSYADKYAQKENIKVKYL